jgi:hypothetical protein
MKPKTTSQTFGIAQWEASPLVVTHTSIMAVLVVVLAVFAIGFPSLYFPFGRDQGIHAFIAKLAGDGLVVYRDVFNVKPPLTTVIHWLAQVLFGETMRAIRFMDLALVGATAVMLQKLVQRHLKSAWLGVVSAVAFAVLHYSNNYWHTAQTDGWCNPFVTAAVLLYSVSLDATSPRRRTGLLALAGFAVGLAFWLKYTSAVILVLFAVVHFLYRRLFRRIVFDAAAVTAGFAACLGVGLLILYAQGALAPFVDIQNFFRAYVEKSKPLSTLLISTKYAVDGAALVGVVAALGTCACAGAILMGKRVVESCALLTWLFLGVVAALAQGKAHIYHLLAMDPSIAASAAVGAGTVVGYLRRFGKLRREFYPILILCCAFVAFSSVRGAYRMTLPVVFGDENDLRTFWEGDRFSKPDFSTADNLALIDYLTRETLACDRVYIWGFEPGVYFMSQRRPVSRFVYNFPMFAAYYRQSYRDEFMTALRADPPAVFVVQHDDRLPRIAGHNNDSAEVLAMFVQLKTFVENRYRARAKVKRFDVYFRKDIDPHGKRAC